MQQNIIICLLFCVSQVLAAQPMGVIKPVPGEHAKKDKFHALVVGVSDYENIQDLSFAHRDSLAGLRRALVASMLDYVQPFLNQLYVANPGSFPPEDYLLPLQKLEAAKDLIQLAIQNALEWRFAPNEKPKTCGTVTYKFEK